MLLLQYHKSCSHCKNIKEFLDFYRHKNKPDNCSSWCKKCVNKSIDKKRRSKISRIWRLTHKEAYCKAQKRWKDKNRKSTKKHSEKYWRKNRTILNIHMRLKAEYERRNLKDTYIKQILYRQGIEITPVIIRIKRGQLIRFRKRKEERLANKIKKGIENGSLYKMLQA